MKFLIALACVSLGSGLSDAATPAEVYTEVNKDLNHYKTLETIYELTDGGQPFNVKAWFSDGIFRRVKASQSGDGGVLTRDFYYDGEGDLKFAVVSLVGDTKTGKPVTAVEERFEFEDDALVRYLSPDKKPVPKEDKSFKEMETALLAMSSDLVERIEGSTAYVGMIGGVNDPDAPKAPAGTVFGAGYADGVFAGTEEGDYFHLDLQQADGEIQTFFVITRDASVDPFLNEPLKAKGKKIRVHWIEKMQDIPEAGGVTRLKVCQKIEELK